MYLEDYHRDSMTWFLPVLLAEFSSMRCCIATRSQLRSQVRFCVAPTTAYFHR
jgi:hypothetical protein